MYPEFDLRSVSKELSRLTRLQLALTNEEDGSVDVKMVKCITPKLDNDVNISVKNLTSDITKGKNLKVGDKVMTSYDRSNKEELIKLAISKLENLKDQRLKISNNNAKVNELYNMGITTGALLKCKIKQILPLGDIILECDRIPDVSIIMTRDKCISETYGIGNELFVIVFKIRVIGDKLTINVSRRSKALVKELIYEAVSNEYDNTSSIVDVVRLVDEGSCAFVDGPFGNYIGKGGKNLKRVIGNLNNEKLRFIKWDKRLPVRVINSFPTGVNVLDIYYPEETGNQEWSVVINSSDFKYVLGRNAQALKFIKLLNKVKVVLYDESSLNIEHKPYKYEGSILSTQNEIVKRYYYYKFNEIGIFNDQDFIRNYRNLRLPGSDIEYLIEDCNQYYSLECPVCGGTVAITDEMCPSCNYNLKVEEV